MNINVDKFTIIGSEKGLSHGRHQAIIQTNAEILLIELLDTLQWNVNRNSNIFVEGNTFENVVCEMLSFSASMC